MKKQMALIVSALAGFFVGATIFGKAEKEEKNKIQIMSDKHLTLFLMMNQWVKIKQEGKQIADYLEQNGYKNIAIYGMSYVGESLLNELKNTTVMVRYVIDQRANELYFELPIFSPDDELEKVDAVIVTAISFIDEIKEKLAPKISCPIISLENILNEI